MADQQTRLDPAVRASVDPKGSIFVASVVLAIMILPIVPQSLGTSSPKLLAITSRRRLPWVPPDGRSYVPPCYRTDDPG